MNTLTKVAERSSGHASSAASTRSPVGRSYLALNTGDGPGVMDTSTAMAKVVTVLSLAVALTSGCGKPDLCCDLLGGGGCHPCPVPGPPARSNYAEIYLDGPSLPFGIASDEMTVTRAVSVRNDGNTPTTKLDIRFEGVAFPCSNGSAYDFAGGVYPGTGGTCGPTLAASGNCQVVVAFSPAKSLCGDQIYLTATYAPPLNSALDEASFRLMLNGNSHTPLGITLSPYHHDFGSVSVGAKRSATFTATNTSGSVEALDCKGFILGANDSSSFVIDGVGGTCCALAELPSAGSCTLDVQFGPPSQGPFQSYLTFSQNPGAPITNTVALSGVGTP